MRKQSSVEPETKPAKKKKTYVSPALVDYGSVTKITAAPKSISSPDGVNVMKGSMG
jgi:hypothetical protein